MQITEVKVFPAREDGGRLKGYATLVFDNSFIVRDLKIIEGHKGLFVSMPSRRRKDGTFRDIVHPLNSDMRAEIERRVIEEYNKIAAAIASGELPARGSQDDDEDSTADASKDESGGWGVAKR